MIGGTKLPQQSRVPVVCRARESSEYLAEVSSPMILTGYAALNKLLGKNVYSSQALFLGQAFFILCPCEAGQIQIF